MNPQMWERERETMAASFRSQEAATDKKSAMAWADRDESPLDEQQASLVLPFSRVAKGQASLTSPGSTRLN